MADTVYHNFMQYGGQVHIYRGANREVIWIAELVIGNLLPLQWVN